MLQRERVMHRLAFSEMHGILYICSVGGDLIQTSQRAMMNEGSRPRAAERYVAQCCKWYAELPIRSLNHCTFMYMQIYIYIYIYIMRRQAQPRATRTLPQWQRVGQWKPSAHASME